MMQPNPVDIADVVETQDRSWFAISIFLLCCLVMLVDGFDNQAINYAAPLIIRDWKIDREVMTPVFTFGILGWMLGATSFSMIGDRIGRRNSIVVAALIFGIFTLAIPLTDNLLDLTALRFLAALGIGGGIPMVVALLSDYAPSKSRALKITVLYLGYTFGSSGGGFLAAELTPVYGWKAIFVVGGVAALAIGVVLLFALPESVRYLVLKNAPQARVLAYAQKLKPHVFDSDTQFVIREGAERGLPVKYLFTHGRTAMTIFLWFALGFSFVTHFYISAWLTTLLSEYSGQMTVPDAQRTQALFQMGAAFGLGMGWLLDKRGVSAVTWVMILGALPVAALGLADYGNAMTMGLASISGILVQGSAPGLNAIAGMVYPTFMRCTGAGAAFAAARIGALLGPVMAGTLIAGGAPLSLIFIVAALPMLAAGAATFMLERSMTPAAMREMASRSAMVRH
jgi:AAHS family 4-hydroxybenzoate transporter-like MFS transporter